VLDLLDLKDLWEIKDPLDLKDLQAQLDFQELL
jgi:hypothetical protein